ncbi:abortive infection family protein [Flavobacterium sp. NRK F7]|uniref:abortive infection family protein n=1 Tax=Flavobacterium sp. NRK F7 TaxID=2954930 RepID=UPI0020917745|nr:abortive infection family protein [Flavobacterium sp. NRK F7]MCO6164499.1 abortive infection family protein [Flavobacterium sp. NRK F7]
MNELISPKYKMKLVEEVESELWNMFTTSKYYNVEKYIENWQIYDNRYTDTGYHIGWAPHFEIKKQKDGITIDLKSTLHSLDNETLLKIAIDIGVDTPDFIPSIPTFKNALKSDYKTAYDTFTKAYKQIETDPSTAVGLANSALESIIKEILKDDRISSKVKGGETLYKLTSIILKEFNLTDGEHPKEIKTIGNSLLTINQTIEKLRSEKTNFHGKTNDDYLINDTIYTFFIVNTVTTVGLFLNSYYKNKFPKLKVELDDNNDDLPF